MPVRESQSARHGRTFALLQEGSRLVWITDLLPNELAGFVTDLADQGAAVIKRTLEADSALSV
jgi:hypothetical protein